MKTFAIVGMGLCGNATFCHLIRLLKNMSIKGEVQILLFEQNLKQFATGFPYSIDNPGIWTLNNPAKDFKFIPHCESLTEWIELNQMFVEETFPTMDKNYVPRALVGYYLKSQYSKHKELASSLGIEVVEIYDEIVDIEQKRDVYQLTCASSHFEIDTVFLTTGHLSHNNFKHIEDKKGFYRFDTNLFTLDAIPKVDNIYIIGGQAAFVDAVLWLRFCRNYSGQIHMVTRNPSVLSTKGNMDSCSTIAQDELREQFKKTSPNSLPFNHMKSSFWNSYQQDAIRPISYNNMPNTHNILHYQLTKLDHHTESSSDIGNIDEFRAFIKTFYLNGCYEYMWNALSESGKEEFLHYFYSVIIAFLTGTTPINARAILKLYEDNIIIEHHGLVDIEYNELLKFRLLFNSSEAINAELVVDATGYSYKPNPNKSAPTLLDRLAKKGLISPKRYGGIDLTNNFEVIDTNKHIHHKLFCFGPTASYAQPVPTPHSSFMVFRDVDIIINQVEKGLRELSGPCDIKEI